MEQRLIDANILLDRLAKVEAVGIPMTLLIKLVEGEQTVDAVPVIRCKDCKYLVWDDDVDFVCVHIGKYMSFDDFCSHGERREDNG